MSSRPNTIEDILGKKGALLHFFEGFEYRHAQIEMARLIRDALMERIPAIVEAGTGTGKTFGYLVPLILSDKRCIISTGTKNLQEQIFFKDIPLLLKATGLKVSALLMAVVGARYLPVRDKPGARVQETNLLMFTGMSYDDQERYRKKLVEDKAPTRSRPTYRSVRRRKR